MITPPKDKPVATDKYVSSEADELKNDEAVADLDTEIKPASKSDDMEDNQTEPENDSRSDLNVDRSDVGLNSEQGDEFL